MLTIVCLVTSDTDAVDQTLHGHCSQMTGLSIIGLCFHLCIKDEESNVPVPNISEGLFTPPDTFEVF